MSQMNILKRLMLQHKYSLMVTYLLFTIEMIALLLRPFFIGMAINDLLVKKYEGLIYLAIVHLLYMIIGTIRHIYDTRTYSAIYASLVTNFLSRRYNNKEVSKLSAHSTLAKEFANFLETDLVYILEAIYNVFGALVMLWFYNPTLVWPCIIILLPVVLLSRYYGVKMENLYKHKNDELEKQVDIIATGNGSAIKRHYSKLRIWQIKISNQEAWNFGFMEILVLLVIGSTLLISTNTTSLLVGNIVGIYSYVLKFVSGLDTIPYAVERFSTLQDITKRIELQAEDLYTFENNIERVA